MLVQSKRMMTSPERREKEKERVVFQLKAVLSLRIRLCLSHSFGFCQIPQETQLIPLTSCELCEHLSLPLSAKLSACSSDHETRDPVCREGSMQGIQRTGNLLLNGVLDECLTA